MLLNDRPFGGSLEFHGGNPHFLGSFAQLLELDFVVTPAANGVVDMTFALDRAIGSEIAQLKNCGGSGGGFDSGTARNLFHGTILRLIVTNTARASREVKRIQR